MRNQVSGLEIIPSALVKPPEGALHLRFVWVLPIALRFVISPLVIFPIEACLLYVLMLSCEG
jgi:hypothetical protein